MLSPDYHREIVPSGLESTYREVVIAALSLFYRHSSLVQKVNTMEGFDTRQKIPVPILIYSGTVYIRCLRDQASLTIHDNNYIVVTMGMCIEPRIKEAKKRRSEKFTPCTRRNHPTTENTAALTFVFCSFCDLFRSVTSRVEIDARHTRTRPVRTEAAQGVGVPFRQITVRRLISLPKSFRGRIMTSPRRREKNRDLRTSPA